MTVSSRKPPRGVEDSVTFGWQGNRRIVRKTCDTCHCEIPTFIFSIQVFSVCRFQFNLLPFSLIHFPNTVIEDLSQNEDIAFVHLYLVSSVFTYLTSIFFLLLLQASFYLVWFKPSLWLLLQAILNIPVCTEFPVDLFTEDISSPV